MTEIVNKILAHYSSDCPGTKANLYRILMQGHLSGTGNLIILPVDQGFEHGPARSFSNNIDAYDPSYHFSLALDAGLSAYAAPLGMLELGADYFAGKIPTILKMNNSNSLKASNIQPHQAVTSSVSDALKLGCSVVGFTIYPGSDNFDEMAEEIRELSLEAKSVGLAVVIWSYPRGGSLSKEGETALDVCAYAAHIACLLGAHIVKVKLPTDHIELDAAKKSYQNISKSTLAQRVQHVKQCCFDGKRMVIFSGGASKKLVDVYNDAKAIIAGGGNGSIIGRNSFQRPKADALEMLSNIINIYKGEVYA